VTVEQLGQDHASAVPLHHLGADVGEMDANGFPALAWEADLADMEVLSDREFEQREEADELPDPLDEEMFLDVYPPAWEVDDARAYLERRGIDDVTATTLQLGWDIDERRIMFPVRDRGGRLYGHTGRAVDHDRQPKIRDYHGLPKRHLILGEHLWRGQPMDQRPVVVVEGLFAFAHLVALNLLEYADVGAVMGSTLTEHKARRLRMREGRTYLLFDNDEAGDTGLFGPPDTSGERDFHSGAVAALLQYVPVYVPAWPDGKSDPDQLTRREVWEMLRDTPVHPIPR